MENNSPSKLRLFTIVLASNIFASAFLYYGLLVSFVGRKFKIKEKVYKDLGK